MGVAANLQLRTRPNMEVHATFTFLLQAFLIGRMPTYTAFAVDHENYSLFIHLKIVLYF